MQKKRKNYLFNIDETNKRQEIDVMEKLNILSALVERAIQNDSLTDFEQSLKNLSLSYPKIPKQVFYNRLLKFALEKTVPNIIKIKKLLEAGADPGFIFQHNKNALHYACENKMISAEVISLLIDKLTYKMTSINHQDDQEKTPLHYACNNLIELQAIDVLLKQGANPNIKNLRQNNALHSLFLRENDKPYHQEKICAIVQLLLSKGVECNEGSVEGLKTLYFAASSRAFHCTIPLLLNHPKTSLLHLNELLPAKNPSHTALYILCHDNASPWVILSMLEHQADPNIKSNLTKKYPIELIHQRQNPLSLFFLAAYGADIKVLPLDDNNNKLYDQMVKLLKELKKQNNNQKQFQEILFDLLHEIQSFNCVEKGFNSLASHTQSQIKMAELCLWYKRNQMELPKIPKFVKFKIHSDIIKDYFLANHDQNNEEYLLSEGKNHENNSINYLINRLTLLVKSSALRLHN